MYHTMDTLITAISLTALLSAVFASNYSALWKNHAFSLKPFKVAVLVNMTDRVTNFDPSPLEQWPECRGQNSLLLACLPISSCTFFSFFLKDWLFDGSNFGYAGSSWLHFGFSLAMTSGATANSGAWLLTLQTTDTAHWASGCGLWSSLVAAPGP